MFNIKHLSFCLLLILFLINSCSKYDTSHKYVKIKTSKGDIIVKLFNETPKHRDNFIKLVEEKFYEGLIFHRVIKDFVIQGGDPSTRNPQKDSLYGNKDAGYLLDAEFVDTIIHKKGAIAMAREGDDVNPQKKSSSSQFYIVIGRVFTKEQLNQLEIKVNKSRKELLYKQLFQNELSKLPDIYDQKQIEKINASIKKELEIAWLNTPKFKFSEKQIQIYTSIGGLPHLDGNYTVFGEVVEGFNFAEDISKVKTDSNNRPVNDIKMNIKLIK